MSVGLVTESADVASMFDNGFPKSTQIPNTIIPSVLGDSTTNVICFLILILSKIIL